MRVCVQHTRQLIAGWTVRRGGVRPADWTLQPGAVGVAARGPGRDYPQVIHRRAARYARGIRPTAFINWLASLARVAAVDLKNWVVRGALASTPLNFCQILTLHTLLDMVYAAAMNPVLSKDTLQELAFESALMYYTPEELAARYNLPESTLLRLQALPEFERLRLKAQREIDEAGTQMKVAARKLVSNLVPHIASIASDPTQTTKDRLDAFKHLSAIAGAIPDPSSNPTGTGFSVTINMPQPAAPPGPVRIFDYDDVVDA